MDMKEIDNDVDAFWRMQRIGDGQLELVETDLEKASFGGDRSAAGRYAANMRWQGQGKEVGFWAENKESDPILDGSRADYLLLDDIEHLKNTGQWDEGLSTSANYKKLAIAGIAKGMQDITAQEAKDCLEILKQTSIAPRTNSDLEEIAQFFVIQWAVTSNDGNKMSLAIQEVARRVFYLDAPVKPLMPKSKIAEQDAIKFLTENPVMEKVMTSFVNAQYASTQAYYESKGITEVVVSRGMGHYRLSQQLKDDRSAHFERLIERGQIQLEARGILTAQERTDDVYGEITDDEYEQLVPRGVVQATLKMRPLSAWSTSEDIANSFAEQMGDDESVFLHTKVPVRQILSNPLTGVGCLDEKEIVVIGEPTDAIASQTSRRSGATNYDNMFRYANSEGLTYD